MRLNEFKRRGMRLALIVVLGLLAACDTSSGARATPTPLRTATPTALPTVLYSADWSKGADGWTLPPHWSIKDGALVNDGGGNDPITVPYTITATDYEIDLVARVVDVSMPLSCANLYGLVADDTNGQQLYYAQVWCVGVSEVHHPAASVLNVTVSGESQYATADFFATVDVKTYRVVVHGKGIRFFPNSSAPVGGAVAPVPLSPANLTLLDQHLKLVITHFTVLQLLV